MDRCDLTYISHYTRLYSSGQVEHGRDTIKSGETGIFVSGHDNAFLNSTIRYSAGAGIYLNGYRHTVHNCLIDEIDYASHYLYSLHVDAEEDFLFGGHTLTYNTLRTPAGAGMGFRHGLVRSPAGRDSPALTLASLFAHNHALQRHCSRRATRVASPAAVPAAARSTACPARCSTTSCTTATTCGACEIFKLGIVYLDFGTCDLDIHHNLLWAAPGSLQRGFWFNTACVNIRERDNVLHKEFTRTCAELKPEDFPAANPSASATTSRIRRRVPKWPQLETMRIEAENSQRDFRRHGEDAARPDGAEGR